MTEKLFKKGHRDLPGMVTLGASLEEAERLFKTALEDRLRELDEIERLGIEVPPYVAQVKRVMAKILGSGGV